MDNKTCRNCGKTLTNGSKCIYCGAKNFDDPVSYSDFTTKKISTKKILIISSILLVIIIFLIVYFNINGIKPKYTTYDTTYNTNSYKCNHAKSCEDNICIYEDENGVEESIDCTNNSSIYNSEN
jgi:hypothetical protein